MHVKSFLYEARHIVLGYMFGKALSTQVSLCRVVGESMAPTLQERTNDVVLLRTVHTAPTDRGGVYVLWHPCKQYKIIKRIVGLPLDEVIQQPNSMHYTSTTPSTTLMESEQGTVMDHSGLSSGEILSRTIQASLLQAHGTTMTSSSPSSTIESDNVVTIPAGYTWVEGDNPPVSEDSRLYGALPVSSISARAVAVVWPPSRIRWLEPVDHPDRRRMKASVVSTLEE
eukprot:PhF_6_TR31775/c0_g1_i3/m.46791/K03100/lepB, TPP; signal peptidase I